MNPTRILLVDDEEALRQLLGKHLVRLGYAVDAAGTAEEALEILDNSHGVYQLVITDLRLPGMAGDELMIQVLDSEPATQVLLSSGYPYDLSFLPPECASRAHFLQKPYLPRQLAEKLNKLIGPGLPPHETSVRIVEAGAPSSQTGSAE